MMKYLVFTVCVVAVLFSFIGCDEENPVTTTTDTLTINDTITDTLNTTDTLIDTINTTDTLTDTVTVQDTLIDTLLASDTVKTPKYIFLFIGDGMGSPQINVTEAVLGMGNINRNDSLKISKAMASINPGQLNMSLFPVAGYATTYADDRYITGSAAAATALACGQKTSIGTIAKTSDQSANIETMAEMAKEKGMSVGIVSSVSIDHATPACFYAHEDSRSNYYNIAAQMATSGFDYFGGGGAKGNTASKRGSNTDIEDIMQDSGYTIVTTRSELNALSAGTKTWAYSANVDRDCALPYQMDMVSSDISLAEFTQAGIDLMEDDPDGFFMMVEAGKVDWACHANDAVTSILDMLAFDEAIGKALEFYNQHPDSTLIIVTGDHECGGLSIGFGGTEYENAFDILQYQTMSYQTFTEKIQALAADTGADSITLSMAMDSVAKYFGLGDASLNSSLALTAYDSTLLAAAYAETWDPNYSGFSYSGQPADFLSYGPYYDPFTVTVTHILNQKAGLAWTSYYHTAVPVPVLAIGQGAHEFQGSYDNTDVALKIISVGDLD